MTRKQRTIREPRMNPRWPRRTKIGLGAAATWMLAGCVFYEVEHDPCLDDSSTCPAGVGGAQTGSGGMAATGGSSMGGSAAGGATASGGGSGVGGSVGGTGGTSSGGSSGSGGTSGTGGAFADPWINEIRPNVGRFVELYNKSDRNDVPANEYRVGTGTNGLDETTLCPLTVSIPPGGFAVLTADGISCADFPAPCLDCDFELTRGSPASTAYVVDKAGEIVTSLKVPDLGEAHEPGSEKSYGSTSDGEPNFSALVASAGEPN